ncbi:MAG: hypothetical protein PGN07_06795 [Aeromicrobium erythreum]
MRISRRVAAAVLGAALVAGVGVGVAAHELRPEGPSERPVARETPTPKPSPTRTKSSAPPRAPSGSSGGGSGAGTTPRPALLPLASLTVTTGGVGPLRAGMTLDEAEDSGYLERVDGPCPLRFRSPYSSALRVSADATSGRVLSFTVVGSVPRTRSGLGVGSTYAQLRDVAQPGGDVGGRAAMFVQDGSGWIGFALDAPTAELTDTSRVVLVQVSAARPALDGAGC